MALQSIMAQLIKPATPIALRIFKKQIIIKQALSLKLMVTA